MFLFQLLFIIYLKIICVNNKTNKEVQHFNLYYLDNKARMNEICAILIIIIVIIEIKKGFEHVKNL